MTAKILADAEEDLELAFHHYEAAQPGLGLEMLDEFRKGIQQIIDHPQAWQQLDDEYRRYRLRRFPYGIVYRIVNEGNEILVVAIMHLSRKPGLWHRRDTE